MWTLLVVYLATNGNYVATMTTIKFETKSQCEAAKKQALELDGKIRATCMKSSAAYADE